MSQDLIKISSEEINLVEIQNAISDPRCGSELIFTGVVRNKNEGRDVTAVTYEAYELLALEVFSKLVEEIREKCPSVVRVAIVHRIGTLKVGEISTVIGVSSVHRGESYEASRYLIEELKVRAPIWKEEHYANGEKEWLEGSELSATSCSDTCRRPVNSDGHTKGESKDTRGNNAA